MPSKTSLFLLLLVLAVPVVTLAQVVDFVPRVGIPGVSGTPTVSSYINALYILAISVAAFLAVLKLIMAGVKYMLTDVITSKESAKKDIRGALVGLLIVIGAALILETINPELRFFTVFENLNETCEREPGSERCVGYVVPRTNDTGPNVRDSLNAPEGFETRAFACESTANCDAARTSCRNINNARYVGEDSGRVICHVPTSSNTGTTTCPDGSVLVGGNCLGGSESIGALPAELQNESAANQTSTCQVMAQNFRSQNTGYDRYRSEVRSVNGQATCFLVYNGS